MTDVPAPAPVFTTSWEQYQHDLAAVRQEKDEIIQGLRDQLNEQRAQQPPPSPSPAEVEAALRAWAFRHDLVGTMLQDLLATVTARLLEGVAPPVSIFRGNT